jgi:peptidoglycan-associated lipoprotein
MQLRSKHIFVLLLATAAVSARPGSAQTAQTTPAPDKPLRSELAIDYSYARSNEPPGGCTCFNLNGVSATYAWPVKPGHFALAGDVTIVHAGSVSASGESLTLSAFTAGIRYLPPIHNARIRPFGQVLAGLVHSSGTVVEGTNPGAANAAAAFAANIGGGLDLKASRRFAIRLFEAGYLLTTVDNSSNNHQNNLRISAGVVMRFGNK